MTFTAREKHDDAMREVKLRQRVYDRMVNVGDMSRALAERRIAIMLEIAFEYKELIGKEELFGADLVPPSRSKAHRRDYRAAQAAGPNPTSAPTGEAAAEEHQPPSLEKTD